MNENYSKESLDYHFKEVENSFKKIQESVDKMATENVASHTKLDENQKATNGKVAELQKFKERSVGAGWAFGVTMTLVVIPLITWAFITISHIPDRINEGIKEALSNYEEVIVK